MQIIDQFRTRLAKTNSGLVIALGVLAFSLLIACVFYCFVIPQTPGRMTRLSFSLSHELPFWSFVTSLSFLKLQGSGVVAYLIIGFTLLGFISYGLAIFLSWGRHATRKTLTTVFLATTLFFLVSTFALPNLNTDIFHYITRARVAAIYGENPHYVSSDAFPGDPIYPYASKRYTKLVGDKLALWTLLSIPMAKVAGDSPVTNLLTFRLAFLLFNLANVAMIAMILRRFNPRYLLAGVILYAWNPIIAVQGQSKTDTVMAFFVILSILLLVYERKRLAIVPLTASVFIKMMTLPFLGLYLLRELKLKRWRELLVALVLIGVTVMAIHIPFWEGSSMIRSHLLVILGQTGRWFPEIIRYLAILISVLAVIGLTYMQDGSHRRLLLAWALIALCMSLFFVRVSLSWYHITFIAIISVLLNWRLVLITVALSFSAFLFNIWYATFSDAFRVLEFFDVPKFFIYLIPTCAAILVIAVVSFFQRKYGAANLQPIVGNNIHGKQEALSNTVEQ